MCVSKRHVSANIFTVIDFYGRWRVWVGFSERVFFEACTSTILGNLSPFCTCIFRLYKFPDPKRTLINFLNKRTSKPTMAFQFWPGFPSSKIFIEIIISYQKSCQNPFIMPYQLLWGWGIGLGVSVMLNLTKF